MVSVLGVSVQGVSVRGVHVLGGYVLEPLCLSSFPQPAEGVYCGCNRLHSAVLNGLCMVEHLIYNCMHIVINV